MTDYPWEVALTVAGLVVVAVLIAAALDSWDKHTLRTRNRGVRR